MTTQPTPIEATEQQAELVPIDDLHLDSRNPRIQQAGIGLDQRTILAVLWREYSVDEVALSIAQNGYFDHEPLFAAEEDGQLVVVEGNRRLAAVRVLLDSELRSELKATNMPQISTQRAEDLAELPVIRCQRDQIWQYIGFKHVNGPQAWNSFAKAEYIAWVRNDLGTELADIALTIGDTHTTTARLYRAYMALKQAKDCGVYDQEKRTRKHFSFSHLYTGLDYAGIREFTGVADLATPTKTPIPTCKMSEFGELCVWLWGDKAREQQALVRSQNPHLRELDDALKSDDGLRALRAGYGLQRSLAVARGDSALFREALLNAKQALKNAHATVVTGFSGEVDLSREIEQIVALADALYDQMSQVSVARRQRRRENREQ